MITFATNKIIHLPKGRKKKNPLSKYPIKWYTQKDYDLFVLKKRPGIIKEYLRWSIEKKIIYATCLIIGEEGGVYWHEDFKPNDKVEKLIETNKLNAIKHEGKLLFLCGPPTDYVYEKLKSEEEENIKFSEIINYGKYNEPKKNLKRNAICVLFVILICIGFSLILGLYTHFYILFKNDFLYI